MRVAFSIICAAGIYTTNGVPIIPSGGEPGRLAQIEATSGDVMGTIADTFTKTIGQLFQPPPPKPKPEPENEMGGIDINLISANKQKSGNCGGGNSGAGGSPGNSKWLGKLPGLNQLQSIFVQRLQEEQPQEDLDHLLTQVHDLSDEEIMSQFESLTQIDNLESRLTQQDKEQMLAQFRDFEPCQGQSA